MTDLSLTIAPKSDQLNADDLIAGPKTIKVTRVVGNDSADQPVSVFYEGDNGKPYKPCLSMRRVMVQVWGSDGSAYAGRSMTLYNDPEVKFGGMKVGGIRISHMSHIDKPKSLMLTTTRSRRAEYVVRPLSDDPEEQVLLNAQAAADKGRDAFAEYWKSDEAKKHRAFLKKHTSDLQSRVEKAEEASKPLSERLKGKAEPEVQEPITIDKNEFAYAEGRQSYLNGENNDPPYVDDEYAQAHWVAGYTDAEQSNAAE